MTEDKTSSPKRPSASAKHGGRLKLEQEYKILGILGIGGMAEVYKAEQTSLSRMVAIKKLKPALSSNPEMMERFFREAQSAANLQHENIVQIYQMGRSDTDHYMVMEYVEGKDLKSILKTAGRVNWQLAGLIARGIALGLHFAHQRGFIHRDIKPGNIMLSFRGEVKIMDFGIVRRIDSELTQTGAFLGTPSYMSPEQLKGLGVTPRSDLFALGVLLYELLAGEKPFRADNEQALILKISTEKEKNVRKYNSEISRRLARIVKRLLKKNPEQRFADAEELALALEKLLGKNAVAAGDLMIAEYLRTVDGLSEADRTKKADQLDSEPVQMEPKAKTRKLQLKTKTGSKKSERSIIGNEWQERGLESSWMVKTVILMAAVLLLILIGYLVNLHPWILSALKNILTGAF